VVDRGLVVWARLLQHVIEHAEPSRGRSRDLADWVDRKGLVPVVVVPLCARFAAGLLALLTPLMLLLDSLDLLTSAGASSTRLPFLP
jgi:hypothetical protein